MRTETCEIVVVGAGMAGLMAATTLSGRDVVVLEGAGRAASSATETSGAMSSTPPRKEPG